MRVVRIGSVILDNAMYIKESGSAYRITGEVRETIGGGIVSFEREREPSTFNYTLESGDYGWQTLPTIEALIALSEDSVGGDVEVQMDSGVTRLCRFRYEVEGGACVAFEPRYEGAPILKGSIFLAVTVW